MATTAEGYTMNIAEQIIELVDVHDWSLSAAKAEFKKLTGKAIKARSKDDLIDKLKEIKHEQLERVASLALS